MNSSIDIQPRIKITRIKNRWHSRLIKNNEVLDEMACEIQEDIGWISREILRWQCKMGSIDKFSQHVRSRQFGSPRGKIWYKKDLDEEKYLHIEKEKLNEYH